MNPLIHRPSCLLYTGIAAALASHATGACAQEPPVAAPAAKPRSAPAEVKFDARFLSNGQGADIDLTRFEQGNAILPGRYLMALYVNAEPRGSIELEYREVEGRDTPLPCIDRGILQRIGLNLGTLQAHDGDVVHALPEEGEFRCLDLAELVPDAQWQTSVEEQAVHISLPQAFLDRRDTRYVPPDQWDRGINAGLLGYQFSTYQQDYRGQRSRSSFVGINAGINLEGWQFRHQGSAGWNDREGFSYNRLQTSLERDLPNLTSRLVLGEKYTEGNIFSSVKLRGVSIESVDAMLPDYMTRYAPTLRGIARTNARVEVFQRGVRIYETSVAPGPFVIDDLNNPINGSALELVVTEADGSVSRQLIPYALTPMNLRAGQVRYSLSAGEAVDTGDNGSKALLQGTLQRGLDDRFTAYGGGSLLQGYQAFVLGTAVNTGIGAFALDISGSMLHQGRPNRQGGARRLSYSNAFNDGATAVTLSSTIRSPGYVDLPDVVQWRGKRRDDEFVVDPQREHKALEATISRSLGAGQGALYLSAARRERFDKRTDNDFSAQYVRSVGRASVTLQVQRSLRSDLWAPQDQSMRDTQVSLTISVPLGPRSSTRAVNLSTRGVRTSTGSAQDVRLSGFGGPDNQFTYGAGLARGEDGRISTSGDLGYESAQVNLRSGFTRSAGSSISASASGGMVIHRGGLTLTSREPQTLALAHAEGAEGARVDNVSQARIGRNGYGVVNALRPYRLNQVSLDAIGTRDDIDLLNTRATTAPTRGAVVMLEFKTARGELRTVDAQRDDGRPLPFGAEVTRANGEVVGVVTQGSRIVLRGEVDQSPLKVSWGPDETQMCLITFSAGNAENLGPAARCVAAERNTQSPDTNTAQQTHAAPGLKVSSIR